MNEQHNALMAFVRDEPESAAFELGLLREEVAELRKEAERTFAWNAACVVVALLVGLFFGWAS